MKEYFIKRINEDLFVCSCNIEIGDRVKVPQTKDNYKNNDFNYEGEVKEISAFEVKVKIGEFDIPFPRTYCMKMIGKVSERAKWVKEGMEFDEADMVAQPAVMSIRKPIKSWHPSHLVDVRVMFKCPNCGEFR